MKRACDMAQKKPNYLVANASKGKSMEIPLEIADTEFSRMRGLMFREKVVPILFVFGFEGKFPIHSHFVAAEFDAVYLSSGGIVTEVFRKIPPNTTLVSPKKDSSHLLELPVEITDRLQIKAGDRLEWKRIK